MYLKVLNVMIKYYFNQNFFIINHLFRLINLPFIILIHQLYFINFLSNFHYYFFHYLNFKFIPINF